MKELNQKLLAIQSGLKAPKNQRNNFGGYNYRSAEDILEAVKPLLAKNGCSLTLSDEILCIGDRFYIKAVATITDGNDSVQVSAFAREDESKKGMDGAQITGSASSYARKYALNGLFCIDDTKDPDATNTHGKENKSIMNASNPLEPASKSTERPLIQEGNDKWFKAIAYCRRNKCSAETLRKSYDISDADIRTMNAILSEEK